MSRRKLLLADDSITIQKVVNLTFADEGIEVIAVSDGNSALDKMMETPPDLVMADVNMPGLSGYELCQRIKGHDRLRHIPVILLVGSFEPFDEAEAARVGADDFLTKPFQSIRQLVNKVTVLLNSRESGAAVVDSAEVSAPDFPGQHSSTPFADTLNPDAATAEAPAETSSPYADAGMDDEMIEASPAEGFGREEPRREFASEGETEDFYDAGKTQPLSAQDLKDFSFVEEHAREIQADARADEAPLAQAEPWQTAGSAIPQESAPARPPFDFDDLNLLEIPFDEEDEADPEIAEDAFSPEAVSSPEASGVPEAETVSSASETGAASESESYSAGGKEPETEFVEEIKEAEEGKTVTESETGEEVQSAVSAENLPFSPEVIEAIARRVVEQLSDRAVKEVAWEVVPQMADLIIKKMAEEKLKE